MGQPATSERAERRNAAGRALHDRDLHAWVQEQVALLRSGRLDEVDVENVAEELADVGKAEESKLDSILRVLVMHMLKWDGQPEFRTPSWVYSIREQRRRYERLIRRNPGLKSLRDAALADMYPSARDWAAAETHLDPSEFPSDCPYGWTDLLERPFAVDDWARERG